jgi:hypothetical protein
MTAASDKLDALLASVGNPIEVANYFRAVAVAQRLAAPQASDAASFAADLFDVLADLLLERAEPQVPRLYVAD